VILLRDTPKGLEAFVIRRVSSMPFAPGMFVFPGGGVSPADQVPSSGAEEWVIASAARNASPADDLRAAALCAVRELHEEADVRVSIDRLVLADHWVTPEIEPRRFDVRFFAAALPTGASARSRSSESDRGFWIRPGAALERFGNEEMPMLRPTVAVFEWLDGHGCVADALEQARRLEIRPKLPVRLDPNDPRRWQLVDAWTGEVLQEIAQGPRMYETDGRLIDAQLPTERS
jgi:8-oxo-dGTP pyrophosphatase MutT (NUDIX family)